MPIKKTKSIPHNIRTSLEDLSNEQVQNLIFEIMPKLRATPAIGPTITSVNADHCIIADCSKKVLIKGSKWKSFENVRRVMYLLRHNRKSTTRKTNLTIGDHQEVVSSCGNPECIKHLEPEQRVKKSPYRRDTYIQSAANKAERIKNEDRYDVFDTDFNDIKNVTGTKYRVFPTGIDSARKGAHEMITYLLTSGLMPIRKNILECFADTTVFSDLNDVAFKEIRKERNHLKGLEKFINGIIATELEGYLDPYNVQNKKYVIDHAEFLTLEDYNDYKKHIQQLKISPFSVDLGSNVELVETKSVHDLLEEYQAFNELEIMPEHEENGAITT